MSEIIPIRIKLFAIYQEVIGTQEITLQVARGTSVAQVLDQLIREYPVLERWRYQTRFGVNHDFVAKDTKVQPQDEVVFIPPVSGG